MNCAITIWPFCDKLNYREYMGHEIYGMHIGRRDVWSFEPNVKRTLKKSLVLRAGLILTNFLFPSESKSSIYVTGSIFWYFGAGWNVGKIIAKLSKQFFWKAGLLLHLFVEDNALRLSKPNPSVNIIKTLSAHISGDSFKINTGPVFWQLPRPPRN